MSLNEIKPCHTADQDEKHGAAHSSQPLFFKVSIFCSHSPGTYIEDSGVELLVRYDTIVSGTVL
ncbi:MAG: hypothetical protein FWH04_05635 [Oscillospiraceae bacterium]|nr:hypothetical protein [Oscillospiraceae bacterium]